MITIHLHGYLKDLHPEPIRVAALSVREAIRFLILIPELQPEPGKFHRVRIRGVKYEQDLDKYPENDEIHIFAHFGGAGGRNGLFQIILGVVLIAVVAIATGGFATPIALSLGGFGSQVLMAGAMMILGGLIAFFSPQPKMDTADDSEASKYLPPSGNTVRIGTRIPILFGTNKWAGHILSLNVDTSKVDPAVGPGGSSSPFGIGGGGSRNWAVHV